MKFRLVADFTFDADNIDHAFLRVSEHFKELHEKEYTQSIGVNGVVEISPVNEKNIQFDPYERCQDVANSQPNGILP